jgi:HD-like signal output (HDOD) protein
MSKEIIKITIPDMIRAMEKVDNLPTIPAIVTRLLRIIDDPETSARELTSILEKDQVLSSKILKVANSAFYSPRADIGTLKKATMILGFNMIRKITVTTGIIDAVTISKSSSEHFDLKGFWGHSIAVAIIAGELGRQFGFPENDKLYFSGLLHDMGILMSLIVMPDYFSSILEQMETENINLIEAEEKRGGFTHTHVGKWICSKWKMPDWITHAAEMHHDPVCARDSILFNDLLARAINIIYFADVIVNLKGIGKAGSLHPSETADPIIWTTLDKHRLDLPKLNSTIIKARQAIDVFWQN